MDIEEVARKYALKNAVEFEGEANPGAVIGKIFAELDIKDKNKGEVQQKAGKIVSKINELSLEEQKEQLEEYSFEEQEKEEHDPIPDLKEAEEGEVVVRFAPNPNGPPHLGSARGMVINGELKEKYDGKLILRYDDTDPVKKRPLEEAYEWYREDYDWLGYEVDEVRYSSKNFDEYIRYAEELIKMGKAYVSEASQEKMQQHRKEGTASKYRKQSAKENMRKWEKMRNGDYEEGEAVLKVKTDLDHKNPAVRDFVAFRIIENPDHPITGNKYRVWPLLDFQGAIEDQLMGTTHIVRGKDLRASTKRQKFIYDYFDWEYPHVKYWGRINVSGFEAPMSTSSMAEMIENGELEGWDDPRAGTLRALRRRGFEPEAIQDFFIDMGVTESFIDASLETLETKNREIVDKEAKRYFFVKKPVQIDIKDFEEDLEAEIALHPEEEGLGNRRHTIKSEDGVASVYISEEDFEDGYYRLKGLCNVQIEDGVVKRVEGDHKDVLERDGEFIHWAPVRSEEVSVKMPDGEELIGRIEPNNIDVGELVQFERFGFAVKDSEDEYIFTHE